MLPDRPPSKHHHSPKLISSSPKRNFLPVLPQIPLPSSSTEDTNSSQAVSSVSSIFKNTCYLCGDLGHFANDCQSSQRLCYNCRQPNHESSKCPFPKQKSFKQCYLCHQIGHVQSECPEKTRLVQGNFMFPQQPSQNVFYQPLHENVSPSMNSTPQMSGNYLPIPGSNSMSNPPIYNPYTTLFYPAYPFSSLMMIPPQSQDFPSVSSVNSYDDRKRRNSSVRSIKKHQHNHSKKK